MTSFGLSQTPTSKSNSYKFKLVRSNTTKLLRNLFHELTIKMTQEILYFLILFPMISQDFPKISQFLMSLWFSSYAPIMTFIKFPNISRCLSDRLSEISTVKQMVPVDSWMDLGSAKQRQKQTHVRKHSRKSSKSNLWFPSELPQVTPDTPNDHQQMSKCCRKDVKILTNKCQYLDEYSLDIYKLFMNVIHEYSTDTYKIMHG